MKCTTMRGEPESVNVQNKHMEQSYVLCDFRPQNITPKIRSYMHICRNYETGLLKQSSLWHITHNLYACYTLVQHTMADIYKLCCGDSNCELQLQ